MTRHEPIPLGKPQYREAMRKLSWPKKVRIIEEMQKMHAPILRARGENPIIWDLKDETPTDKNNPE